MYIYGCLIWCSVLTYPLVALVATAAETELSASRLGIAVATLDVTSRAAMATTDCCSLDDLNISNNSVMDGAVQCAS